MSGVEAYRELVVVRAGGACEYCRLLQDACGVTFHIDHVVPRRGGGRTVMSNLALCCPGCNLAKGRKHQGEDDGGTMRPIYSPRDFEPWLLGWHLHFALAHETGIIRALSPTGEATIRLLKMNDAPRVFARKIQVMAGLLA